MIIDCSGTMSGCFCVLDIAAIGDNIVKDLPHHQNGIPFPSALQ